MPWRIVSHQTVASRCFDTVLASKALLSQWNCCTTVRLFEGLRARSDSDSEQPLHGLLSTRVSDSVLPLPFMRAWGGRETVMNAGRHGKRLCAPAGPGANLRLGLFSLAQRSLLVYGLCVWRVCRLRSRVQKMVFLVAGVLLAAVGFGGGLYVRSTVSAKPQPNDTALATVSVPPIAQEHGDKRRPDFAFIDQDGHKRRIADWDGKVMLVNFWATWCPPCLLEIPYLIGKQAEFASQGLQIVGIALDDVESVKRFAREVGLNYPTAQGAQSAMDIMREFGNQVGGLPFTALVNRSGEIVFRRSGVMSEQELGDLIRKLVAS